MPLARGGRTRGVRPPPRRQGTGSAGARRPRVAGPVVWSQGGARPPRLHVRVRASHCRHRSVDEEAAQASVHLTRSCAARGPRARRAPGSRSPTASRAAAARSGRFLAAAETRVSSPGGRARLVADDFDSGTDPVEGPGAAPAWTSTGAGLRAQQDERAAGSLPVPLATMRARCPFMTIEITRRGPSLATRTGRRHRTHENGAIASWPDCPSRTIPGRTAVRRSCPRAEPDEPFAFAVDEEGQRDRFNGGAVAAPEATEESAAVACNPNVRPPRVIALREGG